MEGSFSTSSVRVHVHVNAVQRKRLTNSMSKNKTPKIMASHRSHVGQNLPVQISSSVARVNGASFSPGSRTVTVVEDRASVSLEPIK